MDASKHKPEQKLLKGIEPSQQIETQTGQEQEEQDTEQLRLEQRVYVERTTSEVSVDRWISYRGSCYHPLLIRIYLTVVLKAGQECGLDNEGLGVKEADPKEMDIDEGPEGMDIDVGGISHHPSGFPRKYSRRSQTSYRSRYARSQQQRGYR